MNCEHKETRTCISAEIELSHKDLLVKYMRRVRNSEGTTFLEWQGGYSDWEKFTDEEWAELKRLEEGM